MIALENNRPPACQATVVTSIIGPCGRFILPLEPDTTTAFHRAAKVLGMEVSELLAEAVHSRILEAIESAKTRRARK